MAFALGSALPTCARRSAPSRRAASGAACAPVGAVAAKAADLRACAAPALAGRRLDRSVRASRRVASSRAAAVVTEAAYKARRQKSWLQGPLPDSHHGAVWRRQRAAAWLPGAVTD